MIVLVSGRKLAALVCSYSISERLSCMHRLKNLVLDLWNAKYDGGLEHLPVLQKLYICSVGDANAALASTSLRGLTTVVRLSSLSSLPCMYRCHACCTCSNYLSFESVLLWDSGRSSSVLHGLLAGPMPRPRLATLPAIGSPAKRSLNQPVSLVGADSSSAARHP